MEATAPGPLAKMSGAAASYARAFTGIRFGARSPEEAERARAKVLDALDYLEQELGEGEYLVGDAFTVADLTAASLFYPLVLPEEVPPPPTSRRPGGWSVSASHLRSAAASSGSRRCSGATASRPSCPIHTMSSWLGFSFGSRPRSASGLCGATPTSTSSRGGSGDRARP